TLQCQVRGGGTEPRRVGRAVRLNVSHPPAGEHVHQARVADERLGLVLRAPVAGEQPVIGVDDLDGHQALEQAPDVGTHRSVGYHQRTPQPTAEARGEPPWPALGQPTSRHNGSGRNWPGSACSLVHRTTRTSELLCPGKPPRAERSSAGPYPLSLAVSR